MNNILFIVMILTSSILYSQGQFGGGISFISENDNDEGDKYWYGSFTDIEGNEIWVVDENCP